MRALAEAYDAKDPCQSRWSGARFKRTETFGWRVSWNRSWKDEASTASASAGSRAANEKGYPTLPQALARRPAARIIPATHSTVVVFPFVPVTATSGTRH